MQRIDNLYVSELEFEDSGMRGQKGDSGDSPYLYIEKVADYIYKAEARHPDYNKAEVFVRKNYPDTDGACAAIAKGSFFGHNYDDRYDRTAEFVMHNPARNGVHASIGLARIPGVLTVDMVDEEDPDDFTKEAYEVLPFFMVDGVNDAGVAVSMHFMQYDNEAYFEDDHGMCSLFAAKYILDKAGSADEAVRLLRMREFWFPVNERVKSGIYLLIADKEKSYVADLYGNRELCIDDKTPILSNFRKIGWDGTKATLELHANGLERYQIMADAYDEINSEDDMIDLLKSIWYTGKYDEEKQDFWFSDYNGDWTDLGYGDVTINSNPEDYEAIVLYDTENYKSRIRDGKTMQTVHTAVYDLDNLTLKLLVQENEKVYRFALDEIDLIYKEIDRAKSAEQAIRDSFYSKVEVDAAIAVVDDKVDDAVSALETAISDTYFELSQDIEDTASDITQETDLKLAGKADAPTNAGQNGDVLYKTSGGAAWGALPTQLPTVTADDNDKVLTVEDGVWVASDKFAGYIRYCNVTVTIGSDNGGVCTGGIIITVKNGDTLEVIGSAEYHGQPLTFRVPRGMHYRIEQSGVWEGYHNPSPEYIEGVASNDVSAIFTYEAITMPTTLRELQIIVNDGNAASMANYIGLQFDDVYTENDVDYNIVWDLKEVHDVYDGDGHVHTGVFLQWHWCTPTALPFDAPERVQVDLEQSPYAEEGLYYYGMSGSTFTLLNVSAGDLLPTTYDAVFVNAVRSADASILRRGYGRYSDSVPRKWLNSDGEAGEWFMPSHVGDAPPSQADSIPGFKKGCSDQILSMVKPVQITTASERNTYYNVCDEFFIPSVTEVNGIQDYATEGVAWADWVTATGSSNPNNGAVNGRKTYAIGTAAAQKVGLRSANVGYQYITWDISTDGSLDGYANASATRRYSPCCVIYK